MEQRIKEILNEVAKIGQMVSQIKEDVPVPLIEIDLILEKIRQLYENVHSLNMISAENSQIPPYEKQKIHELKSEPVPGPGTEPVAKPAAEPVVEPVPEPVVEPVPEPVPESVAETSRETVTESIPEQVPKPGPGKVQKEPEILADKYKGEKKYINETLSQNGKKQDITTKLQSKPIKNIKSSLGINDRFKLINELFNGDKESFENAIGILDDAGNFNEAFNYINSSFEWDMDDESVQMLLDLVRRKFIMSKDDQSVI